MSTRHDSTGHPHRCTRAWVALGLTLLLASSSRATTHVEDFEGGVNPSGWAFIRGGDTFEGSGGNPGGWLHQPVYDTFAPTLDPVFGATTPFRGDYRSTNVTRISLDAQTLDLDFGNGDGFQLTLVLRDANGTPSNFDDDDYVYFIGPNVPRVGEGWTHYDYDIPSQFSGTLPPGWKGGWSGDCETLRPGVNWDDVITNVERVEFWWIDPCLFAIFQQWNVGADNLEIEYGDPTNVEDDGPYGGGFDNANPNGNVTLAVSPNPTSGSTEITLRLTEPGEVSIEIFSADGRHIRSFANDEATSGTRTVLWDGRDGLGQPTPTGIYLVRVEAAGTVSTGRIARVH